MNNFQIETAQNISIQQNTANLSDRLLAYFIDILVIVAYEFLMLFVVITLLQSGNMDDIYLMLIFGLPPFLYHLLFETFWDGRSLGKAALKIRVVKIDGSKATFSAYLIRWLLRIIDISMASGAVAIITILFNGKGQRLGDIAAKTTVITERKKVSLQRTLQVDLPEDYVPKYPQVTLFSDKDMQQIKLIYTKAARNSQHAIILSLSKRVSGVMDVQPEERPMEFIKNVLKDYNYYTQQ